MILRKKIICGVAALLVLNGIMGVLLSRQVARQFKTYLPPGTTVASVGWSPPFGVQLKKLSIPDSKGKNSYLLQADRVTLQIPWWGLLARPIPAKVTMVRPHLKIGSDNIDLLIGGMESDPSQWMLAPFLGVDRKEAASAQGPVLGKVPFIPFGISLVNARVDVIEPTIRAGAPVFIADHVNLSLELVAASSFEPAIRLLSKGDFVTESGEHVGFQDVQILCRPRKKEMEGTFRLRHERLQDFKNLYQYAPRPIFIEGGIADFTMQFEVTGGSRLKLTAHTLVQNLDLNGQVGEVAWTQIMHAVEDENRVYEWIVTTEGDLTDPAYNPHDTVLRGVESKMKEKAASRGLQISGQMFFYADTPRPKEE